MSSENRPVRKAWTRHARSLVLRKRLLVALGVALIAGATTAIVRHHHKAAIQTAAVAPPSQATKPDLSKPPPTSPATTAASMLPASPAVPPASDLRSVPGGESALILAAPTLAPSPAPQVELPPQAAAPPPNPQTVPGLPTIAVTPPGFHVVPSDHDTKSFGAVTMSDRKGRTFTIVPAASAPAPQRTASTALPAMPPSPRSGGFARVGNPAVFSGHARVTGPLTLEVQGQAVQLFGVTLATPEDRCAAPNGTVKSCAVLAQTALAQKLAGHSIVACRVPPGQRGALGAICLDEQGNDLGRFLVIEGLALADSNQGYDYLPAEGAARSAKRGLWRFR
ncbi:MAG: hypothetical protein ACREEL_04970 [Stellaceae bacterium]